MGDIALEIKREDLEKRYGALSDEDIIKTYESGGFTDTALIVLKDELSKRGLSDEKIQAIRKEEEKEKHEEKIERFKEITPPKAPKVWVGFLFVPAVIIAAGIDLSMGNEGDKGIISLSFVVGGFGQVYWLFCVYRIHKILNTLTINRYIITPDKSVWGHFIPFYNIFYWIFKWPDELSKFLNKFGNVTIISGKLIGLLLFISILVGFIIGSFNLIFLFSVIAYINSKIRKQISNIQNDRIQSPTQ